MVNIGNRLFTKQTRDKRHADVAIEGFIDPHGALIRPEKGNFAHTDDNPVRYCNVYLGCQEI